MLYINIKISIPERSTRIVLGLMHRFDLRINIPGTTGTLKHTTGISVYLGLVV